jgi:hypothetical protein
MREGWVTEVSFEAIVKGTDCESQSMVFAGFLAVTSPHEIIVQGDRGMVFLKLRLFEQALGFRHTFHF